MSIADARRMELAQSGPVQPAPKPPHGRPAENDQEASLGGVPFWPEVDFCEESAVFFVLRAADRIGARGYHLVRDPLNEEEGA